MGVVPAYEGSLTGAAVSSILEVLVYAVKLLWLGWDASSGHSRLVSRSTRDVGPMNRACGIGVPW